jgi:hypothetical protein
MKINCYAYRIKRAKIFKDPIQVDSMFIDSDIGVLREFVYKTYLKENQLQESYFRSILQKRLNFYFKSVVDI